MLDIQKIMEAQALAVLLALACTFLVHWPWYHSHPVRSSLGCLPGVSLGFYAGCWRLAVKPHWPPLEDQDRLLLLLLPTVIGTELLAALFSRWRWLIWLARLCVAGAASRVLLHGTTYLTESPFPHSDAWSPWQEWTILGCCAIVFGFVWVMMILLWRREDSISVEISPGRETRWKKCGLILALAVSCHGAALTIMLSGYASGGLLGFPLGAALVGAAFAGLLLAEDPPMEGALGLGTAGLFCLLVMGHFFGSLTILHAMILLFAPLLGWLGEIPWLRKLPWWWLRTLWRPLGSSLPVAIVLFLAWRNFVQGSDVPAPGTAASGVEDSTPQDPTWQDYEIYRR